MGDCLVGQTNLGDCDISVGGVIQAWCEARVEWRCVNHCHYYHKIILTGIGGNHPFPRGKNHFVVPNMDLIVLGNNQDNRCSMEGIKCFADLGFDRQPRSVEMRSDEMTTEEWTTFAPPVNMETVQVAANA